MIGSGGMATVYLAEDLKHRRLVAVKVIKPEIARAIGSDRFLREIEVTARLSHPNILPLFDSGAAGDRLYYVMPFVEGESLRARLDRERRLPVAEALRLSRDVASALGYAHQHGVVHRDIKPENILLMDGIALVADFGIARPIQSAAQAERTQPGTAAGAILGTPGYMSPEQIGHDEVDGRADLYSLACVLFEMLAGEPPFVSPSAPALLRMHLSVSPRSLTTLCPDIPPALDMAMARALEKSPADRFPTAARFAEAIAASVSGSGTATPPPPPAGEAVPPHNLPRQRTHFIGRERDLAECARLLADTELLTITGIGGCGKTRLAIRLAEHLLGTFPDGARFADLAALTDAGHLPATVAAALGLKETPGEDPLVTLTNGVRDKRLLMVLDNCEHLLSACADLTGALLSAGEGVRIIATSREGLGVDGERLFALRSMAVPSVEAAHDVRLLAQVDAVRLFVDRAERAVHDFSLTAQNAAAVADICRRLDGIPLAIELAAARVRVLSPEQIRAKLDDRFRLLTGGSKTALPRQQTLRATIQWSYDLLSPDEQRLLRALSVFANGWTLERLAHVAAGDADEFELMERVGRLIERSLVLLDREPGAEPRYRLLETVRQFAAELSHDADEDQTARRRHADAFLELAEQAYAERFERDEHWTQVLELEHDNLRAALAFVRDADPEQHLRLAGALAWFWQARSHLMEGESQLAAAIAGSAPAPARRARARALWGAAHAMAWRGSAEAGRGMMDEALAMWREIGDLAEVALALEGIGWMQILAGEDEAAHATFEEHLRLQQEHGDPVRINRAMVALAQALVVLSRVDEARRMAEQIIAFSGPRGDRRSEHFGWHFLADCALIEADCPRALSLYGESLKHANAIGDRLEIAFEVQGIAMSLAGLGRPADALRLAGAAHAEWARLGVDLHIRFWDGLMERHIGGARLALGDAATRAWDEGRQVRFEDAIAEAFAAATRRSSCSSAGGRV